MRAFEETSQQGGGGALEVAGDCDSQFQPIETSCIPLFQTSCRDGPAKKEGVYARYQKIHSFKNQPPTLHGLSGAA